MRPVSESSGLADDRATSRGDVILMTDASAEGHTIAVALRERGYVVLDVPLMLLDARVIGESPRVVLLDIDQVGAIERAERLVELPGGASVELFLFGDPLRAAELGRSPTDESVFARPIDLDRLLEQVAAVAQPAPLHYAQRGTTPPPSYAPRRETAPPLARDSELPPVSDLPPLGDPFEARSILPGADEAFGVIGGQISAELDQILRAAEARVGASAPRHSSIPSPDQEGDLLLSAELLAPLDEPLDLEDEESGLEAPAAARRADAGTGVEVAHDRGTHAGTSPGGTSAGVAVETGAGRADEREDEPATELFDPSSDNLERLLLATEGPARMRGTGGPSAEGPSSRRGYAPARTPPTGIMDLGLHLRAAITESPTDGPPYSAGAGRSQPFAAYATHAPATSHAAASTSRRSQAVGATSIPEVFAEGEEARVVALAIAGRLRGSIALTTAGGTRRIVLSDGDIVTAASGHEDETLLSFLVGRGDIEPDVAHRLEGKLPPSGRHAGAALIANGYLGQDDLWPVLRGHAEWIIGRAVVGGPGTAEVEAEPPGRLKAEPNVFGGATGAEVFVETIRRVFPPEVALARLGGPAARVAAGPRSSLLAECALGADEDSAARAAPGHRVDELMALSPELPSVLYALAMLDVVELLRPLGAEPSAPHGGLDPLDEEAVRQRVRARMALVQEGDYFQLLGVPRTATSYEVRRAYLDLRRTFEPSRILTAANADLLDDVRVIVEVLDEAYEVLRDQRRKERYRRAIEAGPPGA